MCDPCSTSERAPTVGDHLMVWRGEMPEGSVFGFWHHGIDCGDGTVVHYAGEPGQEKSKRFAVIRRTPVEDFQMGEEYALHVVQYADEDVYDPEEVVRRAVSKLGKREYHLLKSNCEHFARWCKTGESSSTQAVGGLIGGGIALFAMATGSSIPGALFSGYAFYRKWVDRHGREKRGADKEKGKREARGAQEAVAGEDGGPRERKRARSLDVEEAKRVSSAATMEVVREEESERSAPEDVRPIGGQLLSQASSISRMELWESLAGAEAEGAEEEEEEYNALAVSPIHKLPYGKGAADNYSSDEEIEELIEVPDSDDERFEKESFESSISYAWQR